MSKIKNLALRDRIAFKKHSLLRMYERNICADDVREVLIKGEIIEDYPDVRPLPCARVSGNSDKKETIHAVVAQDLEEDMLWIITVYHPSPEEWNETFIKRRKEK